MPSHLRNAFRRFISNQHGDTAILFALSVVPVLLAAGAAIDYMRYTAAETQLQAALDASALAAAAANLPNSGRIAVAEQMFARNIQGTSLAEASVAHTFKIKNGAVDAMASFDMPTALMHLAGLNNMSVDAATEVVIPEKQKAEIALVLDYSGSMKEVLGGQVKYIAMKNAAKKLVKDLVDANPKNIKFGLVPFSGHVWVTLPKSAVRGQTGSGTWTGCTQDRLYPYNLSDDAPNPADDTTKWGQPIAKLHSGWDCAPYVPNNLVVAPLSNDFAAVNAQLDAMQPYWWTHISLGAEFGFRVLSPNAPFGQGASYSDKKTKKFMVLLTDGSQTEPAFGPGIRNAVQGEANLAEVCGNAKAKGITVITIAYNIDDADTVSRLRGCTTDPAKDFFQIGSDNNVAGAFEEIKKQIASAVRIGK